MFAVYKRIFKLRTFINYNKLNYMYVKAEVMKWLVLLYTFVTSLLLAYTVTSIPVEFYCTVLM